MAGNCAALHPSREATARSIGRLRETRVSAGVRSARAAGIVAVAAVVAEVAGRVEVAEGAEERGTDNRERLLSIRL